MRPFRFLVVVCFTLLISFNPLLAGKWKFLTAHDRIDVVWTSRAPESHTFSLFTTKLDQSVRSYGLGGVRIHAEMIDSENSLGDYYANSPENCARFLREIFLKSETKAVWCGCGGFGAAHVIDILQKGGFELPDKPLIGFSDATYLHLFAHIQKKPSLHAPLAYYSQDMCATNRSPINKETSLGPLMQALKGEIEKVTYTLEVLNPHIFESDSEIPETCVQLPSPVDTTVLGGNLSVIQRNIGTPTALQSAGSVLFLEDTTEAYNRLSDLLLHMGRSGLFKDVHAIFFGDLPVTTLPLPDVLKRLPLFEQKPILQAIGFGHDALNQVLPLGTKATLTFLTAHKATLTISTHESFYA